MGQAITKFLGKGVLHDFFYYVLNDSECHTNCSSVSCDCETHKVEESGEHEVEIDIPDVIHYKQA